jgi:ditrans,polycis-polyprenyl diphosphate synthase
MEERIVPSLHLLTSRRAVLNICAPYTSRDEITTAIRNTVIDYSKPIRPPLKRPFSESHIARNIRAQQLSTVSEADEAGPTETHSSSLETDDSMDSETMGIYNRVDDIVERYLTDLSISDAPASAPTDIIIDCLRDTTLSEEVKKAKIDDVLDGNVEPSDFAELQSLADQMTAHLDPTASSTASTALNLSTSDPTSASGMPTNYPDPETITVNTLTAHTFTGLRTPPLDLLIRTSGVERLSDFLLWQCHQETEIVFVKCMWPEFDLWQFLPVLLEWQWRRGKEGQIERKRGRSKVD